MATATARTSGRAGGARTARTPATALGDRLGFAPGFLPWVVLLGAVFVAATLPGLFARFAEVDVHWSPAHRALAWLAGFVNERVQAPLNRPTADRVTELGTVGALYAVAVVPLAALIRSARVRTWRPAGVSLLAVGLGLVAVPVLTWAAEIAVAVVRLGFLGYHLIMSFLSWISPALKVIGVLVVLALAGYGLYVLIRWIHARRRWVAVALVAATAGALVAAVALGLLDGLFGTLRAVAAAVAAWIGHHIVPVVVFLLVAVFVVAVLLLVLGAVVAVFGYAGRLIVLSFVSARGAGREQGHCADTGAGIGVAVSLLLTAAAIDEGYGARFAQIWAEAPGLRALLSPVGLFDLLLRAPAETVLAPLFRGFNPTVDVVLVVLPAVIAVGALLFGGRWWSGEHHGSMFHPVMITVGLTVAFALPLLVLTYIVNTFTDDS